MVGTSALLSSSGSSATPTPTQKSYTPLPSSAMNSRGSFEREGLQPPNPAAAAAAALNDSRNISLSSSLVSFGPRGSSLNPSIAPGSFSSELRSQILPSRAGSRADLYSNLEKLDEDDDGAVAEGAINQMREALKREEKIKEGSENLLEALNNKKAKQTKDQRMRVEAELNQSNLRIRELRQKLTEAQRRKAAPTTPTRALTDGFFTGTQNSGNTGLRSPPGASRSGAGSDFDDGPEVSPSYALTETLQALEVDGMAPEYYVGRANSLVELFKRNPTLKYDLVWSIFGLRMQVMLLSESREVVAAGYRMLRYAISDVASLRKIRSLNTDYLVVLSLIKERKADVEREQALKFVRAFLDVKDGVHEVSRAVVRTIVSVAEPSDDRLMSICIETLAEILVRDPPLLIASGGLAVLSEVLSEGLYKAPESLAGAMLFLLDHPQRRRYLRAGYQLEVLFTPFTDSLLSTEALLKKNATAISAALKSWSGLMSLSMYDFRAIRSVVSSLRIPTPSIRETILNMVYSLLRIKSPAWASSFLAGRRLTTYGRVATLKSTAPKGSAASTDADEVGDEQNFVEHFTAVLLAIFMRAGLMQGLLEVTKDKENPTLKRKATLLIGEVLKLSSRLLPPSWSGEMQLLPELFSDAAAFGREDHYLAGQVVYQISSVSRTLYRSSPSTVTPGALPSVNDSDILQDEQPKGGNAQVTFDDAAFRQVLIESAVLSSSNPAKWNWDIILKIIEGPFTNGKRLEEAIKASRYVKRLMSFYRPFKYKFSDIKNTRNTQKYIKVGCALVHSLLQSPEGVKYLADSKLLRQIAECLAQCDPTSGLTAQYPMFARERLTDNLCVGYFPMIGVLSSDPKGLQMLDRWRMFNMMYHIIDRQQRPDLIKLLLSHFDYSLQSHPRLLLSKAITAGAKDIRIHGTNVLKKYVCGSRAGAGGVANAKWAIQLLVTQLYDPEIEVCATAVKILEKACNNKGLLEYVVQCRPSLDHLGEIGAPLLLRFLSTSIGYHYLDGLDYISNEMDDWFLGRNDTYVSVVEASLARAFSETREKEDTSNRMSLLDDGDVEPEPHVPPHFYRELTRTKEGCGLLRQKKHFDEFANTIRDYGMQYEDTELVTKVKGSLWAVGNVGSMELGAEFLESTDVVEQVVEIAQSHQIMSMRGTAFFVLGLISRSIHGIEILSEMGWDSNTTDLGTSLGFCIPTNLSKLFSLQPWKHVPASQIWLPETQRTMSQTEESSSELVGSERNSTNKRILELVVDLGNTVLFRKSMTELMVLRQKKAIGFRQVAMFLKVMTIIEQHHYTLNARRAIVECFDKAVLKYVVFEEEGHDMDEEVGGRSRGASKSSVQAQQHTRQSQARPLLTAVTPGIRGGGKHHSSGSDDNHSDYSGDELSFEEDEEEGG